MKLHRFPVVFLGLLVLAGFLLLSACSDEQAQLPGTWPGSSVPRLVLQTEVDEQQLNHRRVQSTDGYIYAAFSIDAKDGFDDLAVTRVKLRGRGHSSFQQPKKSFKLKLPSKTSLLGLPAGKDWALLANFDDTSLMASVLAMQLGRLLAVPFTPVLQPVELTLNNRYMGVYWLTPHKQVGKGRIALPAGSVLLELGRDGAPENDPYDKNHYQWVSPQFQLPVQVHYPRLHKRAAKSLPLAGQLFDSITADFSAFEQALLAPGPSKANEQGLDKDSLARFLLVYEFTRNRNINTPDSIYLHKVPGGSYQFGPLWDFDLAFGGGPDTDFFIAQYDSPLLADESVGGRFFQHLWQDAGVRTLARQKWDAFRQEGLGELRTIMADYIDLLDQSGAYRRDYARWQQAQSSVKGSQRQSLRDYEKDMHRWLDERAAYMDRLLGDAQRQMKPKEAVHASK